jgi:RES domain
VKFSGTLYRVVTRGHTGRSIPAAADFELAKEWADVGDRDALMSHSTANRFRADLKCVPTAGGDELICIHGRKDDSKITNWRDMGPGTGAGRYSRVNALYLSDSVAGVLKELGAPPGTKVFTQEYALSPAAVRLADCSSVHVTDLVKAVFDMAENSEVNGRVGPSEVFCQVVGQMVQEAGFNGMVVPGVRGIPGGQYCNIVVFDVNDRWKMWSRQDAGFGSVIV